MFVFCFFFCLYYYLCRHLNLLKSVVSLVGSLMRILDGHQGMLPTQSIGISLVLSELLSWLCSFNSSIRPHCHLSLVLMWWMDHLSSLALLQRQSQQNRASTCCPLQRDKRKRKRERDVKGPVADCTHAVSMQDAALSHSYSAGTVQGMNPEIIRRGDRKCLRLQSTGVQCHNTPMTSFELVLRSRALSIHHKEETIRIH